MSGINSISSSSSSSPILRDEIGKAVSKRRRQDNEKERDDMEIESSAEQSTPVIDERFLRIAIPPTLEIFRKSGDKGEVLRHSCGVLLDTRDSVEKAIENKKQCPSCNKEAKIEDFSSPLFLNEFRVHIHEKTIPFIVSSYAQIKNLSEENLTLKREVKDLEESSRSNRAFQSYWVAKDHIKKNELDEAKKVIIAELQDEPDGIINKKFKSLLVKIVTKQIDIHIETATRYSHYSKIIDEYEKAIELFNEVNSYNLDLDSSFASKRKEVYQLISKICYSSGKKYLKKANNDFDKTQTEKAKKEYIKAIDLFEKTIKFDSRDFTEVYSNLKVSYFNLANCYIIEGNNSYSESNLELAKNSFKKAIDYYNKYIEKDIDNDIEQFLNGSHHIEGDDSYEKGFFHLAKAHYYLANVNLDEKDFLVAIENYKEAINAFSKINLEDFSQKEMFCTVRYNLAITYLSLAAENYSKDQIGIAKKNYDIAIEENLDLVELLKSDVYKDISNDFRANVLNNLGGSFEGFAHIHQNSRDYDLAIVKYIDAKKAYNLALDIQIEDIDTIKRTSNNLGNVIYNLADIYILMFDNSTKEKDLEKAKEQINKTNELLKELEELKQEKLIFDDEDLKMNLLNLQIKTNLRSFRVVESIAQGLFENKEYQKSIDTYTTAYLDREKKLNEFENPKDKAIMQLSIADSHLMISKAFVEIKDLDKAKSSIESAKSIIEKELSNSDNDKINVKLAEKLAEVFRQKASVNKLIS